MNDSPETAPKPPSQTPDGRTNPAYKRWMRATEEGKAQLKIYNARQHAKRRSGIPHNSSKEYSELFPFGMVRCMKCKIAARKEMALDDGWKKIVERKWICPSCV